MKNKIKFSLLFIMVAMLFTSCADSQIELQECLKGHEYGFWAGLWHGLIMPFAFIGSLIDKEISIYAINNNGTWYNLGFVIGTLTTISGSTKVKFKKRK